MKKYKKPLEKFYFEFRKKKDLVLVPIIISLDKLGLTADLITLLRVALAIFATILIRSNVYLSFFLFVLTYLLDGLDGSLARYQKKMSARGALIDILSDQFTIVVLLLGLIFFRKVEAFGAALYMILFISSVFLNIKTKNISEIPYFYSKFWFIAAATLWVFTSINLIDTVLIGLNIYLLSVLTFDVYSLIKANR